MINEIISVEQSVGSEYTHQLSDKDDITSVTLNRCLRYVYDTFVNTFDDRSGTVLNLAEEDNHLLKFRVEPISAELTDEDTINMSFGYDNPSSTSGYHVIEGRGNFAEEGGITEGGGEVVYLEYVNYPSQIYRSIRALGSSVTEKTLDISYVDDTAYAGRYYKDPIGLRKAYDTSDDATFGVVGRLWNHSASLNAQTLSATTTDQTLSSGGWMPDATSVSPVSAYDKEIASKQFAPTVDAMYANEFPYMMFNLVSNPNANMESGTYSVPGYNSIEISYTSILLNCDIGMTFGAIKILRGSDDFQEIELDINLKTSILENRCPKDLLFANFGNGVMNGVTAVSYKNSNTGGKARVVNEILSPTVMQTGPFSFLLSDITKTTYGDVTYFNATTGMKKDDEAISNVRVSNRSYEIYYMLMYRVNVWAEGTSYATGDRVWYLTHGYESRMDGNTDIPGSGSTWLQLF